MDLRSGDSYTWLDNSMVEREPRLMFFVAARLQGLQDETCVNEICINLCTCNVDVVIKGHGVGAA